MKKKPGILLVSLLLTGCACVHNPDNPSKKPLIEISQRKSISKIEVYTQYDRKLVNTVADKSLIADFQKGLSACEPMPLIDTNGRYVLIIYSEIGVLELDADVSFVRVRKLHGGDAYFRCTDNFSELLKRMGLSPIRITHIK